MFLTRMLPFSKLRTINRIFHTPKNEAGNYLVGRNRHGSSTYLVTQSVSLHWLTRVSRSSSLCGRTVINSIVLRLAQNSLLAGST